MLIYSLIIIACILSFVSALAIFSALVVAGRNERFENNEPTSNELFLSWNVRDRKFDEAALKRLVDSA